METKINIYKINGKTYYGCTVDGKKVIKDTAVGALFELGVGFIDLLDFFDGKVFSKLITSSIFNTHIDEIIEINGKKFRFISAYQPEPKHL